MLKEKYMNFEFENITNFICNWTWQELKIGIEKELVTNEDVIKYAKKILNEDTKQFESVLKLSILNNYDNIEELLKELINTEEKQEKKYILDKWRYALLLNLYNEKSKHENIYRMIDEIYADFDYPNDMNSFVSYMPKVNDKGIIENYKEFLEKMEKNI